ncbi:hypothetical protein FQN49_007648, partial [Arthroderma sp. PD_2]
SFSKAFGMAGIRLGAAFTSPPIASLLNCLKAPWNIPSPSSTLARYAISEEGLSIMRQNRAKIKAQRDRLLEELPNISSVGRVRSGTDSNFLLFEMLNSQGQPDNTVAEAVYDKLAKTKGVVLRFRGKETGCFGCLRITIGTEDEITRFLDSLRRTLTEMWKGSWPRAEDGKSTDTRTRNLELDVSYFPQSSSGVSYQGTGDEQGKETNGVVVY